MNPKKIVYFPLPQHAKVPDKIFLDTSIVILLMLSNPERDHQKHYVQDLLKLILDRIGEIATCSHVIQEASYVILRSKIEDDLIMQGLTEIEAQNWMTTHYKRDKRFIDKYIPQIAIFSQWVSQQNWVVFPDTTESMDKSVKLMEKYSLLPRDAFILSNAFDRKYKCIAVKDKDFSDIDEIEMVYCPSYHKPKTS